MSLLGTALLSGTAASNAGQPLPGLVYAPEGDAIVIHNGTEWNNRPLYCARRITVVLAGEQPSLNGPMGILYAGIERSGTRVLLQNFANRVARYRPGRMEWEMSDPRFPGMTVRLIGTTLADANGFAAQLKVEGAQPGDSAAWCYFPQPVDKAAEAQRRADGFQVGHVAGRFSDPAGSWESIAFNDRENLDKAAPGAAANGLVAWIPLLNGRPQCLAVADDDNDPSVKQPLDPAKVVADPAQAFADGVARAEAVGKRVVVETPDPYFNAGVAASCAAMYGLYVEPHFVHGGTAWRMQLLGWRVRGGATAYGWHDLVQTSVADFLTSQVKGSPKVSTDADAFGCEQSGNSRMYGSGYVSKGNGFYGMQTQFFDEAIRDWRATGDVAFAKLLLPALELHLIRQKECFDPDGDGLYESYINTWPSDSQWYNGGGTVEESAYVYYAQRAAAEMQRLAGNNTAAAQHDAEAEHIRESLDRVLWLKDRGQYAAYVEQGGHHRVHDDAWVYSEHLPIEAGLATPLQAWQAMYYTDWAMEKYKLPYGSEMRQTSNWAPGQWSIRELYHGDNFAMALGYFLAGQGDDGWGILRSAMLESMYGDAAPKAGYGNEGNLFGQSNIRSPGGLSRPNCGIDFNDITTMFCRAVVEGLFGYQPDYPNEIVRVMPAFPSAWDHASIKTPDYALSYKREANSDRYTVSLTRPARMQLRLPVRATTVKAVMVNGKAATWKIEPWAGCGMLELAIPAGNTAEVAIELAGRVPVAPAVEITKKVGEATPLPNAIDPQGCLGGNARPGHHLAFARVERGNVPYLQAYKIQVTDPEGEKRRAEKNLRQAPADAQWLTVPMGDQFNGDIRTVFQQKYLSPRPATVSCRIGYDGWSAWTFKHWGFKVPEIKLDRVASLLDGQRMLKTPQGARFLWPGEGSNIAFTSLWDNWPKSVTVPVGQSGDAVWLLICGSTNPMQGRIANAVIRFHYADGRDESLELTPPWNFWSLCRFGPADYDSKKDGFALPKEAPSQVQLGENCRAMVYGWKLRPGAVLKTVTLETVSQEVVIGLVGVSMMNPK
ncbi:MAG: hypothetical protein WC789_13065 [Lentisphaeria bacterium]